MTGCIIFIRCGLGHGEMLESGWKAVRYVSHIINTTYTNTAQHKYIYFTMQVHFVPIKSLPCVGIHT
jgi:hypothetical protein